ncbi:mannitol-1-phosphate 5-dehydrogenase [Paenibacillus albicereus]|uniref:Mannitol-1-phosphate 5-dehydrogenase n=1 Tax=Paenibacillus albicereus TaxID=2726185 RepID=A0A6H2GTI3_9BACL|nr:mannitol-1-phosphate 5-dehydrogenase [Paenibacillus albicereus]QJC50476.1 mannitol-1-phosphate 5-dehydrogenase [Paenibacillus albicereus]
MNAAQPNLAMQELAAGRVGAEPASHSSPVREPAPARPKAVHFGAGNIGRGLVGVTLARAGYEIVFAARNPEQIRLLREHRAYEVEYADEAGRRETVGPVGAVAIGKEKELADAIETAELITTAVGLSALPSIAKVLAKALESRLAKPVGRPLPIIACENGIRASSQLKRLVFRHLPERLREPAERQLAFPDSMVDRIVPAQKQPDPLAVRVEPFSEWIVEKGGAEPMRRIRGVRYVGDLDPWMERKLFTVNTGHCAAAYFGYLAGFRTIQEALASEPVRSKVREALRETGTMLARRHGFDAAEHEAYIEETLQRFANPALSDKISRIARSPRRKLGQGDRLVRPLLLGHELGLEMPALQEAIAAALAYRHPLDAESVELERLLRRDGLEGALSRKLGLPRTHDLVRSVCAAYDRLGR